MRHLHPWLIAVLVVAALHCSPADPGGEDPLRIDHPDLSRLDDTVRAQLTAARRAMETAIASPEMPARARAYGDLGKLYHAYALLVPAIACYRNAVSLDPSDPAWAYYLGLALVADERLDEAVEQFKRAADLGDDGLALLRLGEIRFHQNRLDEAREHFRRALSLDERSAAATYGLGRIAVVEADHQGAARWFERTLALQPSATRVHYPLAIAYRNLERPERARYHLERRGGVDVIVGDARLSELSGLTRGSVAHLSAARTAAKLGLLPRAVDEYRRAVEADPSSLTPRLTLAWTLARMGRLDEADAEYREALALHPEDAGARFARADLLAAMGRREEAERLFRSGLALDPENLEARVRLAWLLDASSRTAEAFDLYLAVLEAEPTYAEALRRKTDILLRLGRAEEAAATLRDWIAAAPGDPVPRINLATLIAPRGDIAGALEQLRIATRLDGDDPTLALAHFNLAAILARDGGTTESLAHYRKAVELDPTGSMPAFRTALAENLAALGRRDEARDVLEQAGLARPTEAE